MVADLLAGTFGVEEPSLGALDADVSVPFGASVILGSPLATSVYYAITLIAGLADSLGFIKLAAQVTDLAADSFFIEGVSIGALKALVFCPGFTSIIISYVD